MGDERVRMDGGEGSMGKGTRMMVWALVFGLLVLFLGAVADVVCLLMDWEEEIIVPIVRAIASAGFICLLGGKRCTSSTRTRCATPGSSPFPSCSSTSPLWCCCLWGRSSEPLRAR